jgi:hypothetical protein
MTSSMTVKNTNSLSFPLVARAYHYSNNLIMSYVQVKNLYLLEYV